MVQNNTVLTTAEHSSLVCYLTTKPPHHPHHSTVTLIWLTCGDIS